MTYQEAIDFLYNSLPVFQKIGAGAYKPGLDTSHRLDTLYGHPHRSYPTVHIAGTNGKGSTAHTLAAILGAAGYKVGLYTSPHIFDFRERIRINGKKISHDAVISFVESWLQLKKNNPDLSPSFFELTSTLAFRYFADCGVDIAIIETGLGGRLDSTNIITPILSVITNISFDHTALLGDSLTKIATEKAGIIKPGVPVIIGEHGDQSDPVFENTACAMGSALFYATPVETMLLDNCNVYPDTPFGELRGELCGCYQARNTATVIAAVIRLRDAGFNLTDASIAEGFSHAASSTGLFGRWSEIASDPLTICDTGHNSGGWEYIVRQLREMPYPTIQLVMGFVADKDISHILEIIASLGDKVSLWFSAPSVPRGLDAYGLAAKATDFGLSGIVKPDVNDAMAAAREAAGANGFVLIAGSNFLIADLQLRD